MSRPKILLALAQAAFPALERALSLHADLLFADVLARATELLRVSVNAVGLALKALGAVDYIDFAKLAAELGDERAEEQVCRSLVGILEAGIARA
jgi:hypothetical protein